MSYGKDGHSSVSQVWSLPDPSNTHSSGLWSMLPPITSCDNGRWSTATGSKSSRNYWCGFPLWILLVLTRKLTEEAKRAMKDLEQLGEELRFLRQRPGLRCSGDRARQRPALCPPGATHSETLSPVSLDHGETNPGSHVEHRATANGHDPTKPKLYFNRISI